MQPIYMVSMIVDIVWCVLVSVMYIYEIEDFGAIRPCRHSLSFYALSLLQWYSQGGMDDTCYTVVVLSPERLGLPSLLHGCSSLCSLCVSVCVFYAKGKIFLKAEIPSLLVGWFKELFHLTFSQ